PVLTLSAATVKLDNEFFPRGLFCQDERLPFLPAANHNKLTLAAQPLEPDRVQSRLQKLSGSEKLVSGAVERLQTWWQGAAASLAPLDRLWKQISRLNLRLFNDLLAPELRRAVPGYYMVPME